MSVNNLIKSVFWNIDDSNGELLYENALKPFENHPLCFADDRVNEAVGYHNKKWDHNEIVVKTAATIEPQYGYAVQGLRTVIGASIRTRDHLPSPIPMIKAKYLGQKEKLTKAILFDGSMGINYFHFMSDVLHKIYVLENHTRIDCPLLVGNQVFNKSFFQYLIKKTELSKFQWKPVTQPVEVDELYVARPMPYQPEYWKRTKKLFIEKDANPSERSAIFINRKGTRRITNYEAIEKLLTEFGVEVFEPSDLNVREQAEAFNSATHVIGIHGAGLTNVMFCNYGTTKVLELCSNNRIGTQYYWLCTALGIDWNMLLGGEAETDQSFELNPEEFRKSLEKLFAS